MKPGAEGPLGDGRKDHCLMCHLCNPTQAKSMPLKRKLVFYLCHLAAFHLFHLFLGEFWAAFKLGDK
jgi:hypothetical protein